MLEKTFVAIVLTMLTGFASAQSTVRPKFMERAIVRHNRSGVTVIANHSVPLYQAICAIREEYGWKVNWEAAPLNSQFDLVDDTGPRWRAAHPGVKGVTRPAGGGFVSSFAEPKNSLDPSAERELLTKVIQDYNATDNPGKFDLRQDSDGQFTVVGIKVRDEAGALQGIVPVLDTPVFISREPRTVEDLIRIVLDQVSLATGKKIHIANFSSNPLMNAPVTLGGDSVVARNLLQLALASTKRPLQYDLLYDADISEYGLTTSVAVKAQVNSLNERRITPIDVNTAPVITHD
jgi:hypothetical protein